MRKHPAGGQVSGCACDSHQVLKCAHEGGAKAALVQFFCVAQVYYLVDQLGLGREEQMCVVLNGNLNESNGVKGQFVTSKSKMPELKLFGLFVCIIPANETNVPSIASPHRAIIIREEEEGAKEFFYK